MKKILILLGAILLSANMSFADDSDLILGKWKTYDDNGFQDGIVQVYKENDLYFGNIIYITKPEDREALCTKGRGEDKDKPIMGLVILKNLKKNGEKGADYTGGTILDPYSGKVYNCSVFILEKGKKLQIKGSLSWWPYLSSSVYWDKYEGENIPDA